MALAFAVVLSACGEDAPLIPPDGDAPVTSVELTPGDVTLAAPSETAELQAVALDADGDTVETAPEAFEWSSPDTEVVTVDSTGTLTAGEEGSALVTAELDGRQDTAEVTVTAPPPEDEASVTSVDLTPAEVTLAADETAELQAVALDADGDTVETAPEAFGWSSSNTAVVTVDSTGTLAAGEEGSALVTAELDGKQDTAEVTARGDTSQTGHPAYKLVDLAEEAGLAGTSEAVDINSEGRVLISHREDERVVVWDSQRGIVASLNAPGDSIRPAAISDLGKVVGGMVTDQGEWRGFFWDPATDEVVELPTFGDGTWSEATDLNDRGQVVGIADTVMTAFGGHTERWTEAFIWEVGEDHLRHLGRLSSDAATSHPSGINNVGDVAGSAYNSAGSWHPFVWNEKDGMVKIGGHLISPATAINDQGEIVGYTDAPGPEYWAPFIWHGSTWRVLDRFEEQSTAFLDISNNGTVVGLTAFSRDRLQRYVVESELVLWSEKEGYTLLPFTGRPHALNDQAVVVGWYTSDGERHAALWEPQ